MFLLESNKFVAPDKIDMALRSALYFTRAAAALSAAQSPLASVRNRLQIASSYLVQAQSRMSSTVESAASFSDSAHAANSELSTVVIGPADTRSSASLASVVTPASLGTILGDATKSPLALETGYGTPAANGAMPYEISGVSVTIGGKAAQLLAVSPSQINFYVPAGLAGGEAEVIVTSLDGHVSRGTTTITPLAPAIFTVGGSGSGEAVVVNATTFAKGAFDVTTQPLAGTDTRTRLAILTTGISGGGAANTNTTNDVRNNGEVLANFAESVAVEARTGDGRTFRLPVEYAGVQGRYVGLDQVNVVLLSELKGAGNVALTLIVGGVRSNSASVTIR